MPDWLNRFLAGILLLASAPLWLWIVWHIRREDGDPVLFRQERVGRGGRRFTCLKFRSMLPGAEARLSEILARNPKFAQEYQRDHKLRQDPRVTSFGRFLRRSSLDELPQLLNVLRGEMALVGPRPLLPAELAEYGDALQWYGKVRPGLTGLWQISGRSDTTFRERIALDTQYVQQKTVLLDLWILGRTLPLLIHRRGAR